MIERLPHENVGVGVGTAARSEHVGYAGLLLSQARNGLELTQLMIDTAPIGDTALVADPVTLRQRGAHVEVHPPSSAARSCSTSVTSMYREPRPMCPAPAGIF